jgi:hypothetical protein
VTIGKNQCNPWQKNLAAFGRQAGKNQKSILKVNFKSQFQKSISKIKRQGKPNYYAILQQSEKPL